MDFQLEQWHWWALCLASMVIAALKRGTFTLWLAFASGILGAVSWLTPETPTMYQLMLFVLLMMGGTVVSDYFVKQRPDDPPQPEEVRQAGERYIGRLITLETPIVNGFGALTIDGVEWRLRGEDTPIGGQVRVLDADGIDREVLIVERVESEANSF